MKTIQLITCACVAAGMMLAGCGPSTGYIVKPVPLDEQLKETVIASDGGWVSDKLAIIDIDGLLMNARSGGLMGSGENPVALFVEKMDKAQDDSRVKSVLLRINSPGGGVTASDIMHQRVLRFRKERPDVKVYAIIEDIGASGAYYVACAAEKIIAHPTSTVGSIGVIVQLVSFSGTLDKLGIEARAITSGKFKDMASPLKPMNKEDQAVIQKLVDDYYNRFVKVVVDGRKGRLSPDQVRALADGRVFSADQARENGLVDSLQYMDDAITTIKTAAETPRVKIVMYHRPWGNRQNAYSSEAAIGGSGAAALGLMNISLEAVTDIGRPRFLYLWTGRN
ncbi:MAG: signal peptide peptidase SppA [Planctomycetaceae bacterium]|nr:signal peptide peptidase SppA [Planctomycetaceae bacterium]